MPERLLISRLGRRGEGIADSARGPLYVPYALPEETIEAEAVAGHPDRRHLLSIEAASVERIAPICRHFGVCGGCALQHLSRSAYRTWKRDIVVRALAAAGLAAPVADLVDAHGRGRRRAIFHARRGTHDALQVGFAAYRSHRLVPIDACPILAPELDGALDVARRIAELLVRPDKPLDIQAIATESGLDIDVRGSGPLPPLVTARLAQVAERHRLARLTRHGELVAQRAVPAARMGRACVALPAGAFLQATAAGEQVLADFTSRAVGKVREVADLFSGVGPFALRLAAAARVMAVDSDAAALAALGQAAAATPGLKPVETRRRDLFRSPLGARELARFEAVVLDPPRQGAEAQARQIAASRVPVVVAISCNPGTFARDARILVDGGYRLMEVTPIDQFLYSAHVEIAARLERP